ncbi:hypothetical protein GKQ23_05995 [Erwinia sp. E602]|uniref:InvB/SpaK family type III secretion system chaperone n=1 Tax=Erwinia sp. E602 TaxID=2675378 RepID=UPI001BAA8925|nr:hypothetical protein [Erwinia sp. E602]QUG74585.1 hypothetical protein GKQ23_05995 [Erwinia sp. E602]
MKYDVVKLVNEILQDAGMAHVIEGDLSNHSTISLNLKDDNPTIYIKNEDDEVWVWAKLCDYNLAALGYCSTNLFPVMFNYNEEFFYTGQPCLYPVDGDLQLRAKVKDEFLESSSAFMDVLDNYMTIMLEYRSVLL